MNSVCMVDWHAFGLANPDGGPCGQPAGFIVAQGCIHEHVARSPACYGHVGEMCSYGEPAEWLCDPCLRAGHDCPAPLVIEEAPCASTPVSPGD